MAKKWWILFLVLWVAGVLFPFEALRLYWPSYKRAFDAVFDREIAHVLAHSIVFGVLAAVLRRKYSLRTTMLVVVGLGVLEEIIQAATGGEYDAGDGVYDVGVDTVGASIGVMIVWLRARRKALREIDKRKESGQSAPTVVSARATKPIRDA